MMTLPIVFLVVYFVTILLVARLFASKAQNLKDFFLAGRRLGAFPVALTFVASWFGAASTMGSINAFHDHGLSGAWQIVLPSVLSFVAITLFMAKPVARQTHMSQPEAVEAHYGRLGRLLLSLIILTSVIVLLGSQMVVAGKFFQMVFGLDITLATVISTAVVVSYAMWGGYFTVVVTDIAQVALIALGFTILFWFTATQAVPDASAWQHFIQHQPANFWNWTDGWQKNVFLSLTFLLAWSIAPEMWQRMSSTRNPELAFRAGWQATLMMLVLFSLIVSIGLLSTQLIGKHDAVLIALALSIPNQLLSGLVLMGFLAAVTSTMDSSMNVGSLTITRDLYQGFLRPQASDRELIRIGRIATVISVVPAMAIALYFQDLIRILWISADIYACSMFFPVICMLYLKRPSRLGGILAMIVGCVTVIISALVQNGLVPNVIHWPDWPYSTLLGTGLSGMGYGFGTWLSRTPVQPETKPTLVEPETCPAVLSEPEPEPALALTETH
jgi:SSS family solute:Na+ symporter